MKHSAVFGFLAACCASFAQAAPVSLASPDGSVTVQIAVNNGELRYAVSRNNEPILVPSLLRLTFDDGGLGGVEIVETRTRSVDQTHALVATKAATTRDRFNEVTLSLRTGSKSVPTLVWSFRAYDNGVAFRYAVPAGHVNELLVRNEESEFGFAADFACYGLNIGRVDSSHEGEFDPVRARHIREHHLYDLPLTCATPSGRNAFAITEANLVDYGGMYLNGRGDGGLGVRSRISRRIDGSGLIAKIPMTADGVASPWRVIMLADSHGKLIDSTLIANLNPAPSFDTSWIRPGKTAWDWWSGPYLPAPDKGGTDTPTIKRYIDFAGASGFEYMLIDEGWCLNSGTGGKALAEADITRTKPGIDMPELVRYAAAKKVSLLLWVQWELLDRQMDAALAQYEKWGIKGIKVDFMDRNDQQMVDYYHRLMKKAAARKLLVDMHGAYPPTGLARTYPHYLTQEGIMGAEYNKWSRRVTATHNVTLAYTRMLLGPVDYTPGGFRNVTPEKFQVVNSPPQVMTTRGQALAMFVVYESPLQMVADSPDAYQGAQGFDFLRDVPTTWDETRFLQGDIAEYVVLARRKGSDWYLGAMTNEAGRKLSVPLAFLGEGSFTAKVWEDGAIPTALRESQRSVTQNDALTLTLGASGGAAVRLVRSRK